MKRLILVCTGTKYSEWFVDNMYYMIDKWSNLKFDERVVIREDKFDTSMNKLQMFDLFRDGQNLYFDLDIVIKGPISDLIFQKDFTILRAWWRQSFNIPYNSSIMSWFGDMSHIYNKYMSYKIYYDLKYGPNDDIFIAENIKCKQYPNDICYSYYWDFEKTNNEKFNICLFNQNKDIMEKEDGWWSKYTLPKSN